MDFFKLQVFLEIAKTGNLTIASTKLNTSQPAVSTQLKALEESLGYSLFHRNPKGMRLTKQGETLLRDAEKILESIETFNRKASSLTIEKEEHLSIGLNTNSSSLRIEELLDVLNANKPSPIINFVQTKSEDFESDIMAKKIQAGFFYGTCRHPDIEVINLKKVAMHIILPLSWSKNYLFPKELSQLSIYPWIWTNKGCPFYKLVSTYFKKKNFLPKKIFYIDDETLIASLVEKEMACSILAEPIAELFAQDRKLVTFAIPDLTVNLNFGLRKDRKNSPPMKDLVQTIRSLWNPKDSM